MSVQQIHFLAVICKYFTLLTADNDVINWLEQIIKNALNATAM